MNVEQRLKFAELMRSYYREESERSNKCLADLITIFTDDVGTAENQRDAVLERLIAHYERRDVCR